MIKWLGLVAALPSDTQRVYSFLVDSLEEKGVDYLRYVLGSVLFGQFKKLGIPSYSMKNIH